MVASRACIAVAIINATAARPRLVLAARPAPGTGKPVGSPNCCGTAVLAFSCG
jgi:hypothetical protein